MKFKKEIELVPFTVPNYVLEVGKPGLKQDGFRGGTKYHVSELEEETLIALADKFKEDLIAKKRNAGQEMEAL